MKKEEIKQITDYIDENFILDDSYVEKSYKECGNFYHLLQLRSNIPMPTYNKTLVQISDIIKDNFAFADKYGVILIKKFKWLGNIYFGY